MRREFVSVTIVNVITIIVGFSRKKKKKIEHRSGKSKLNVSCSTPRIYGFKLSISPNYFFFFIFRKIFFNL